MDIFVKDFQLLAFRSVCGNTRDFNARGRQISCNLTIPQRPKVNVKLQGSQNHFPDSRYRFIFFKFRDNFQSCFFKINHVTSQLHGKYSYSRVANKDLTFCFSFLVCVHNHHHIFCFVSTLQIIFAPLLLL